MPKPEKEQKQVLIIVRHGKRGYIVQAAGSEDPYPCLSAEDVGEAVLEILADPEQPSMAFEEPAPEPEPQQAARDPEDGQPAGDGFQNPPPPQEDRPAGWTAGDELLVGLFGNAVQKLRNASWRNK